MTDAGRSAIEVSGAVRTEAGMLALWNPVRFATVIDLETWEARLVEDEDIVCEVEAGSLVPVNVGGDIAAGVVVRVGLPGQPATLTEREARRRLVSSKPYLYVSDGDARMSGIETISADPDDLVLRIELPAGRYQTVVHLLDWEAEPGARDETGRPAVALPDFIVLLDDEPSPPPTYCTDVRTFPRPPER